MFIVLYADDILLIAPPVCMLGKLLNVREHELHLHLLDMVINVKNLVVSELEQGIISIVLPSVHSKVACYNE